jgi:hypothetical protein
MDPQEIHLLLEQYLLLGVDMGQRMQIQVDLVVQVVVVVVDPDQMVVRQQTFQDQLNKVFLVVQEMVMMVPVLVAVAAEQVVPDKIFHLLHQ